MLPVIDALNGYFVRHKSIYGIGSVYHLFLLMMMVLLAYARDLKINKLDKYVLLICCVFIMSGSMNEVFLSNYADISLERVEKIITTALLLSSIYRLRIKGVLSNETFSKIFMYQLWSIGLITLFANITGLANYTYSYNQFGRIGFYTGTNESIGIFVLLSSCILYNLYINISKKFFVLFVVYEFNLIYAQSKASYIFAILYLILFIFVLFKKEVIRGKSSKSTLFVFMIGIIGVYFAKDVLEKTIVAFLNRQKVLQDAYLTSGFFSYFSSGRTTRLQLLSDMFQRNPIITAFQLLFGQGFNFNYNQTFEMDYLDIFLYGGLFALLLSIGICLFSLKKSYKNTGTKFALIMILLWFLFSFFVGHLWTGGASGVYLALCLNYFMTTSSVVKDDLMSVKNNRKSKPFLEI